MKNLLPIIFFLALSCKKEEQAQPQQSTQTATAGANWLVINGDGHNNDTAYFTRDLEAKRVNASSQTVMQVMSQVSPYKSLQMWINSDQIGTTQLVENYPQATTIVGFDGGYFYPNFTVNITRYDAVGGLIEGDYSGTMKKGTDTTISVAVHGVFSLERVQDL